MSFSDICPLYKLSKFAFLVKSVLEIISVDVLLEDPTCLLLRFPSVSVGERHSSLDCIERHQLLPAVMQVFPLISTKAWQVPRKWHYRPKQADCSPIQGLQLAP